MLTVLPDQAVRVFHVPSHLDPDRTESPFEDWLQQHNMHADTIAGLCNANRTVELNEQMEAANVFFQKHLHAGRALRSIFFKVADIDQQQKRPIADLEEIEDTLLAPALPAVPRPLLLEESLSPGWKGVLEPAATPLPVRFLHAVCDFLFDQDGLSDNAVAISWLELVFMLHKVRFDGFPTPGCNGALADPQELTFRPLPPTVAGRLRLLRCAERISFCVLMAFWWLVWIVRIVGFVFLLMV